MNKYLPHAYILKHTKSIKRVYIHKNIRREKEKKDKEKEQKGSHSKESTLIDWPNSLTIVPSGVANYRNLPFGGRATRDSWVRLPRKENAWSRHQRSGVVFTHGEGISTPRVCHKGQQPLIKCANMTLICFMFPFTFLCLFVPFIFLSFCGRQGCFPWSYVFLNCDKEIRST